MLHNLKVMRLKWMLLMLLFLYRMDQHASGETPGETHRHTYVEVLSDFYKANAEMVDALWEANEDMPDSCRTDLCPEESMQDGEGKYNLIFAKTRGGERRFALCPWSLDGTHYAYRDCTIKMDGSFLKKSDFAGVEWKHFSTRGCPHSPISQVVQNLFAGEMHLSQDRVKMDRAMDDMIDIIERFPKTEIHEKYLLPYVYLLHKMVTAYSNNTDNTNEKRMPWTRAKKVLRLLNEVFYYDTQWGLLFEEEFEYEEFLHSIAIALLQYVFDHVYTIFERDGQETYEQENLIFVPVDPAEQGRVSGDYVPITKGFKYHRYYLREGYTFNITEADKIYVEKTIPQVDLQVQEADSSYALFVIKSSYIWFDQTFAADAVSPDRILSYDISEYFDTIFYRFVMSSSKHDDDDASYPDSNFPEEYGSYGSYNYDDTGYHNPSYDMSNHTDFDDNFDDFFGSGDVENDTYWSDYNNYNYNGSATWYDHSYEDWLMDDDYHDLMNVTDGLKNDNSQQTGFSGNYTSAFNESMSALVSTSIPIANQSEDISVDANNSSSTANSKLAEVFTQMMNDVGITTTQAPGSARKRRGVPSEVRMQESDHMYENKEETQHHRKLLVATANAAKHTHIQSDRHTEILTPNNAEKRKEKPYRVMLESKMHIKESTGSGVEMSERYHEMMMRKRLSFRHSGKAEAKFKGQKVKTMNVASGGNTVYDGYHHANRRKRFVDMILYFGAIGPLVLLTGNINISGNTSSTLNISIYMGYANNFDVHIMGNSEIGYVGILDISSNRTDKWCDTSFDYNTSVLDASCSGPGMFTGFAPRVYIPDSLFPNDPLILKINLPSFFGFFYSFHVTIVENVLGGISLACLLCTAVTYFNLRKDQANVSTRILLNLCVSLITLSFVLNVVHNVELTRSTCRIVNILRYYLIFVTLLWNGVEAVSMYLKIVKVYNSYVRRFLLKAAIIAWGFPVLFVVVNLLVSKKAFDGEYVMLQELMNQGECTYRCQLRQSTLYYGYLTPLCLILANNLTIFGMITYIMVKQGKKTEKDQFHRTLTQLTGAVAVLVLLGIPWIFSVFGAFNAQVSDKMTAVQGFMQLVFAIAVNIQGMFIFGFYCLKKKDVRATWKRMLHF